MLRRVGPSPVDCQGAPLEYWYFKVNGDGVAFLVDFIVRRRAGTAELRISCWQDGAGRVVRAGGTAAIADGVSIAGCALTATRSSGRVEDIEWDLTLEAGPTFLDPRNALLRLLRPLDMALVSWPRARIQGEIALGGRRFQLPPTPALISHYWGRRLPPTWRWISANQFSEPEVALEVMVLRSHLWGAPWPVVAAGYFFLERRGVRELVVAPHGGQIRIDQRGPELLLTARRFGGPATEVRLSLPSGPSNDLGEGISQTLLGTCVLADGTTAAGTCGIEHRV